MIEYKPTSSSDIIAVFLDGKKTGTIRHFKFNGVFDQWQYFPKGSKTGGEMFCSLTGCKKSLFKETINNVRE